MTIVSSDEDFYARTPILGESDLSSETSESGRPVVLRMIGWFSIESI